MFGRTKLTFPPSPRDLRLQAWDEVRSQAHTFPTCEDETLALLPRGASPAVPGTMARRPEGERADLGPGAMEGKGRSRQVSHIPASCTRAQP